MSSTPSLRHSSDSSPSSPTLVPGLSGTCSTSRLILLPNTDTRDPSEEYATDDEDENGESGPQPGVDQLSIPPLSPSVVFLYLLCPYLRLGAIYASDFGDVSLSYGLTGLVVAASLSAFCRQIWFLLGRYLRKSSTEDVLICTFARRRRRVHKYNLARYALTIIGCLFKLLLAAMYLRDSVDSVLLLNVSESILFHSRLNVSILLSILVFVLSLSKSLSSKSVVYTTGLSVASYLAWLVVVSRSYATHGFPPPILSSFRRGVLWNEISSLTFACTTALTVPLSASLAAEISSTPVASKNARTSSFQLLNTCSTVLAALLMLPLVINAASPRAPASTTTSGNFILGLRTVTLALSIPSVVVSITSFPQHSAIHRFTRTNVALCFVTVVIFALSLAPPTVASILDDITLFFAIFGTFPLPALVHVAIHYFRRPLSIVVPHAPSSAPSTPRPSIPELLPSASRDPLLQRKERLLQRSRLGKRLLWDFVIWVILIPICGCAFVWAAGRLARQW